MERQRISDVVFEDIHSWDAPDFVDAFVSSATYDGVQMTADQLEELNEDGDLKSELLTDYLY